MASNCSILYEELLLCSICLGEFNEPVSTPCGHNFCKGCIMKYWNSLVSGPAQCPLCKKKLGNKPRLQVNTEFRDMVEHFNHMRVKDLPKIIAKPGEVTCDICTKPKLKASKTCLVCLASYCEIHLESHQNLNKHKLIDPVSNLEDKVCKKHDKMLELYCCTDEECVCLICLNDDHTSHKVVPLERAFKDRKAIFDNLTSELKEMENVMSGSVRKNKDSVQRSRDMSVNDIGQLVQVWRALVAFLQRKQGELVKEIEEKQKESEKQAEDQITLLEQKLSDLKRRRSDIEKRIQLEDYLYLLQSCQFKQIPENTYQIDQLTEQPTNVKIVKKSVAQIKERVIKEVDTLINKVRSSDFSEPPEQSDEDENKRMGNSVQDAWRPPKDRLMMIQQCNAVNVTLNSYSAHPHLTVSGDGKTLSLRQSEQWFPVLRWQFKSCCAVLANEGFNSGRFYYEVVVPNSQYLVLGVVKESVNREVWPLSPEQGAWLWFGPYFQENIEKIGVFVDYEKGEVSFYDVNSRTLLQSLTECCFTETKTGVQGLLYSVIGLSPVYRPKIYPFFMYNGCYLQDSLTITPVECTC
ncbi:PREDICTED: E3 ubiquitin-protein ligase TRIM39-like [Cyprinodon variegatus]|uniref:E3 ubiquitin-protein ligase TRIM39-like n=1 Tax=Cyprinodon variegatus TaxID=28743 RepID=UPI000742C6EC|nr:PREDICTED: E3 ubiquitin-protein ligase TRIM39-like [Cyprinodon variegatus]